MISAAILSSISEHFKRCAPKEGCGVLALKRGELKWIPCTNIAQEDEDFILDTNEYLKIYYTHEIVGIVHNHVHSSCKPSETDIKYCNITRIPYYIFSYPSMESCILEPRESYL